MPPLGAFAGEKSSQALLWSWISPATLLCYVPSTGDPCGTHTHVCPFWSVYLPSSLGLSGFTASAFSFLPCEFPPLRRPLEGPEWWEKPGMGRCCFILSFVCLALNILGLKVTRSSPHSSIIVLLCWLLGKESFQPLILSVWDLSSREFRGVFAETSSSCIFYCVLSL